METIDKNNLISYLSEMPFNYRSTLNVPEEMHFGTEIEFMTSNTSESDRSVRKVINRNSTFKKIYKFGVNNRVEVQNRNKRIYEIKTPVFSNNEEDFMSLKNVCNGLESINVMTSNEKGIHVHTDLSVLENNNRFLETFLKLFCIYEHIIFRFSYGEENESTINMTSYSRMVSHKLYKYLKNYNRSMSYDNFLRELRELLKCKSYAINFHQKDDSCKNETIEVRTFNSTTNSVIIQNDINLVLSIINQIVNNSIDIDLLDYRFSEYDRGFYVKEKYSDLHLDDAIEFSDMIFNDSVDKDYFLRQYVIKDKPKQKKLVI